MGTQARSERMIPMPDTYAFLMIWIVIIVVAVCEVGSYLGASGDDTSAQDDWGDGRAAGK